MANQSNYHLHILCSSTTLLSCKKYLSNRNQQFVIYLLPFVYFFPLFSFVHMSRFYCLVTETNILQKNEYIAQKFMLINWKLFIEFLTLFVCVCILRVSKSNFLWHEIIFELFSQVRDITKIFDCFPFISHIFKNICILIEIKKFETWNKIEIFYDILHPLINFPPLGTNYLKIFFHIFTIFSLFLCKNKKNFISSLNSLKNFI